MVSQGRTHGYRIYDYHVPATRNLSGGLDAAGAGEGDIIEFEACVLEYERASRVPGQRTWRREETGQHTAVILGAKRSTVTVLEQNVDSRKVVQPGSYDLRHMVKGRVQIFRPVGESWCPPLETSW
ncbi:MAG: hypothetical protein M1838_003339 [Thelocarpon superellum]|nr:MAG: hypothetical protein M1838_003339 [Thelocarpon superellum]